MKFVLAIAFVIVCIGAEVWAKEESCKKYIDKITKEELAELRKGTYNDGKAPKEVMCSVRCLLKALDLLEDDDTIKEEEFLENFSTYLGKHPKDEFKKCNAEVGKDECETTFKIIMCLNESMEENA